MLHCLIITAIRLMLCSRQIQKFTTRSFIPLNMPCESINLVSAHLIILFCLNQKHRRPVQFPRYAFQLDIIIASFTIGNIHDTIFDGLARCFKKEDSDLHSKLCALSTLSPSDDVKKIQLPLHSQVAPLIIIVLILLSLFFLAMVTDWAKQRTCVQDFCRS